MSSKLHPDSRRQEAETEEPAYIVRSEQSFDLRENLADRWSPELHLPGTRLGPLAGLARLKVNMVRIPPGSQLADYHTLQQEEEWVFVLKGRGVVVISDVEHMVGTGDFVGFPGGSEPHQVRNPFEQSLLCLVGGEQVAMDVADFPHQGRRMFRYGDRFEVYDPNEAEEAASAEMDAMLAEHWPTEIDIDITMDGQRRPKRR